MIPRIGIPVPTSTDLEYNRRSWPAYAACVEKSGGEPVRLELGSNRSDWMAAARTCMGFCIPGSPQDVEPSLYGEERDPATAPHDPARFALDTLLFEHAIAAGKPVLAICYGLQSLNVWRGGSLVQDIAPLPVNHGAGKQVAVAHAVLAARESFLASLFDPNEAAPDREFLRLPVNSSHHQAVASPGTGLRIVARCPEDGVIEALEVDPESFEGAPAFLVGVQWHPERSYDISATSRTLFDRLVQEARRAATAAIAAPLAVVPEHA